MPSRPPESPLIGTSHDLTVTSLGGLGDGIAHIGTTPVFISKACIGDTLRARITHQNHEGATAIITQLLTPGPARQPAPCPYFHACGGCTLQQLREAEYREFKTAMLRSALTRAGYAPDHAEVRFLPPATRRRVEFKTHFPEGKLQLAFYEPRSRNPVSIATCLILHPRLETLMQPLQHALRQLNFQQHIRAVSVTLADSGTDLLLHVSAVTPKPDVELAALLQNLGLARATLQVGEAAPVIAATRIPVTMRFGETDMPLPPDAFLQATAEGQHDLTQSVLAHLPQQGRVVDLFSGLGTYSFPLLARQPVHAVEMDAAMVTALRATSRPGFTAEMRDLFKEPLTASELSAFAAAVINPPRAGAKAQAQAIAQSRLSHVAMVSCNPATFMRDAALLKQAGFALIAAHGLDQFVWSPHLEIFAAFAR